MNAGIHNAFIRMISRCIADKRSTTVSLLQPDKLWINQKNGNSLQAMNWVAENSFMDLSSVQVLQGGQEVGMHTQLSCPEADPLP